MRGDFLVDQLAQISALPAALRQQGVRAGKRAYSAIHGSDVGTYRVGARKPHDRLHKRKRIAGAVIDLARQQRLALFGFFALSDIDGHAADANDLVGRIDARDGSADAPAQLPVRTADAKLALVCRLVRRPRFDCILQMLPVVGMNEAADILDGEIEMVGLDTEDPILSVVPDEPAGKRVPFP